MSDDKYLDSPHLQSGYTGEEGSYRQRSGPTVTTRGLSAEANRGRRAPQAGSGVVIGSGAGAGGAGGAEDFDSDPAGGGGEGPSIIDDHHITGADAPVGGSR
ncbi:hypothetical protein [Sphingomonas crocodyli]|uniref:Uncharacterized protein n=1 Tax=Sphingomonas crocodyli TaxID=1979270 RepID=A0A437LY82_9SPHN|nr:hypothetical protein [Sphingomonas crocodyli]RVT90388.1 hypothetical protein EOD43_19175 [Sphingomonas crocodyli]